MAVRQKVMVLYLASPALDSGVIAWSFYDGTGEKRHMAGDDDDPPFRTGLHALEEGWRLIQANPVISHVAGNELTTSYLKYEFFFEMMIDIDSKSDDKDA
ncbi:MAG: hypothetical protein VB957_08565 [Pseudomonadales bacterium]